MAIGCLPTNLSLVSFQVIKPHHRLRTHAYRAVVLKQFHIRTSSVQGLQTPHQVLGRASESFGNSHIKNMNATLLLAKLLEYFFLSEGVVLKFLGCLCRIDMRREDIMQTELTRKHVHHQSKRIVGSRRV